MGIAAARNPTAAMPSASSASRPVSRARCRTVTEAISLWAGRGVQQGAVKFAAGKRLAESKMLDESQIFKTERPFMRKHAGVCSCVLLTGALAMIGVPGAAAQDAAPPPAAAAPAPAAGNLVLQEGSDVDLKFDQGLSSKTAAEGDPVVLVLADDLKVGDVVVARAGCKAYGEVTHAKRAGMMGKGGELNMRLDYLKVGDKKVMLRGSKGREGDDKTGTAVALTVLFGPIGLIKHGKEIDIKPGTPLKAYVADDVTLSPVA